MKTDRLIGILSVLLRRDKMTAAELSRMFEVSRRTILRDVDTLSLAGIPVVSEQGQGGGIYIMENYKVDRALLSEDDMRAILTGLKGLDSVTNSGSYRRLAAKLSAEEENVKPDDHIIVDLSGWDKAAYADRIEIIKTAMDRDERICFTYHSPTCEGERTIEPYHLVYQWSGWYVWGWCCDRCDWRMFKLTRMTALELTGEKRIRRDIPPYECDKLRHTKGEIEATVRFDSSVRWRIIDEFGAECAENAGGDIILTFTWSDVPAFYRYMLTFGDKAEILAPTEYRSEYLALLENIIKKYK
ncbi:MAG: YafY family transcriptional regulator [Oscillospiraceae bacterium]|nr:YafY family transcriptional regulator [Oscillospiraceae bacterium]